MKNCQICRIDFMENDRVIFSHKETFIFKPAQARDTVNAAQVSPDELAQSRKEYLKTAVVNTFCDWGKIILPQDAFYFRHQFCEPVKTAASVGAAHAQNKHQVRFGRSLVKRGAH